MRKNINKVITFAVVLSVMGGGIPVFAEEINKSVSSVEDQNARLQKRFLTLEDAIDLAVNNSETLALDDKKISYQEKINDVKEEMDDVNDEDDDLKDFNSDTSENMLEKLKQQKDFDKDSLIQKTTTAYNNIVTNQMKIDNSAKVIEINNKKLKDANLKKDLGISTLIDVKNIQLQNQKLENQQKLSINTLKDLQYSFKVLTSKDVTQYTLEQDIKYDRFKVEGSVDGYLDDVIDKYQKYNVQLLKINKEYYNDKDHQVTDEDIRNAKKDAENAENEMSALIKPIDPSDGEANLRYSNQVTSYSNIIANYSKMLGERLSYLNNKLNVYVQQTTIDETKKIYKDSLKSAYTQLIYSEDNIDYMNKYILLNNEQLKNVKLKYDLGIMTKSDYDIQVTSAVDLDIQLREAVDSYNKLKNQIQKPWLLNS